MPTVVEIRDVCVNTQHLLCVWIASGSTERVIHVKPGNNQPEHGEPITVLGNIAIVGADNRTLEVVG